MILKIIDHGSDEYQQMIQLRTDILRKPLGLTFSPEELEKDKDEVLIGAFEDEKILGCCIVVRADTKNCRLRQMAVLHTQQGKGIGRALVGYAEKLVLELNCRRLRMHVRKTAVGFYEALGYSVVGKEFLEVTIPHLIMEKQL